MSFFYFLCHNSVDEHFVNSVICDFEHHVSDLAPSEQVIASEVDVIKREREHGKNEKCYHVNAKSTVIKFVIILVTQNSS